MSVYRALRGIPSRVAWGLYYSTLDGSERLGRRLRRGRLRRSTLGRHLVDLLLWPSDCMKVRREYRRVFGAWPPLFSPRTFNEVMQTTKLFRRRPIHVTFADKLAARDYVAGRVGPQHLTRVLWTGTDLRDAPRADLPDRFVIKANQGSGTNIVVTDKQRFDWEAAGRTTAGWLRQDQSMYFAEWQYRWIPPTLFIEEYLEGPDGVVPPDYKYFCFHGRVQFVQADFNRFGGHTLGFYDREFRPLQVGIRYPRHLAPVSAPRCFDEMIRLAERLANREPFLRVDLYDLGRPIFGELTLHPSSGLIPFDPPEWDYIFGRLIRERIDLADVLRSEVPDAAESRVRRGSAF